MANKKDSEEEQKEKLVAEIIKLMYPVDMSPPTENMTTLERENHERLLNAAYPSRQQNPFGKIQKALEARLREKSLKELHTILKEESKKKSDERSFKTINKLVSKIQAKVNGGYNDRQQATIEDENKGAYQKKPPTVPAKEPINTGVQRERRHRPRNQIYKLVWEKLLTENGLEYGWEGIVSAIPSIHYDKDRGEILGTDEFNEPLSIKKKSFQNTFSKMKKKLMY